MRTCPHPSALGRDTSPTWVSDLSRSRAQPIIKCTVNVYKPMKVNRKSVDVRDRPDTAIAKALSTGFGALCGAVLGLFGLPILIRFLGDVDHPQLRLSCGIVGGILGGACSYPKASRESRRYFELKDVAKQLGLQYSDEASAEQGNRLGYLFGGSGSLSFRHVMHRKIESGRLIVADIRQVGSEIKIEQTVAFVEDENLKLPQFQMLPVSFMKNLLARMARATIVDFVGSPEFTSKYHVSGEQPDEIRQLFGKELLDYFAISPGWELKAKGDRIVIFHPGTCIRPAKIEPFVHDVIEMLYKFQRASSSG